MCRFALYMGSPITLDVLTTRPANSIIHQSYKSQLGEEPLNGDGFGIAWYAPGISSDPVRFCSIQPAWNNTNLRQLARVASGRVILAHVRAATAGLSVSEANCHPFTVGAFSFMHNGFVSGFTGLKRRIQQRLSDDAFLGIGGTTDSEHVFALFRDNFARLEGTQQTARMAEALAATISEVVALTHDAKVPEPSLLNLAVSDGVSAVVSRYSTGSAEAPSLYYREASRCVCEDGNCRMVDTGEPCRALLVASEPLTEEEGWSSVPPNHLVMVNPDCSYELRKLL